jgi:peptidoglycan/xylan/chitin deacetylase (PgdA/CDA1 family)
MVRPGGSGGGRPEQLVLSYHAASSTWDSPLAVRPERLEAQLCHLRARGYRGATVHQAVHEPPSERTMAISFDDGYRSVLQIAFPILERLGFVGTVFVPTDFPETGRPMAWPGIDHWLGTPHEQELCPLSWTELRQLVQSGWEIGSHACSHPHLPELSDGRLERELALSRQRVEKELGQPCRSLAYPFGSYDERVVRAVRAAGYSTACAVPVGRSSTDPLAFPRIGIYRPDGMAAFRLKVSPRLRRVRRSTVADLLLPIARLRGALTR